MKKYIKKWTDYPVQSVTIEQISYPVSLKKLSDPPAKLYYRGDLFPDTFEKSIAIVGSRAMTRYGKLVCEEMTSSFVSLGMTIVSGFMYGIDAVAHATAVEMMGKTVAVFGCGISQVYPPDHDKLYNLILQNGGAVLSEFEPEQKPKPWMYAKRNRVVAALSNSGVVVIEASVKSGSIITAKAAIKLRKKVYAVPGPINSHTSEGTNWLIKSKKAIMITSAEDITKTKSTKAKTYSPTSLSPSQSKIIKALKSEGTPLSIDEIAVISGVGVSEISRQMTVMTISGMLEEIAGKYAIHS